MTLRQTLAKIRKLLAADERDDVRQGFALARDLEMPEVDAVLADGIAIDRKGKPSWSKTSEIQRRVRPPHRSFAALWALRVTGGLASVTALDLSDLDLTEGLQDLEGLWGDPPVGGGQPEDVGLRSLRISGFGVYSLSPLAALTDLKSLRVDGGHEVPDLSPLAALTALESLALDRIQRVNDLAPLAGLSRLQTLQIWQVGAVGSLAPVAALTDLRRLELTRARPGDGFGALAALTKLRHLDLSNTNVGADLGPLADMTALRVLRLNNSNVRDLSPLAGLTKLTELSLRGARGEDLAPLAGLAKLKALDLNRARGVADLSPLAGCARLETLDIQETAVSDVTPLSGLTALKQLSWAGAPISDLSPLAALTELTRGLRLSRGYIKRRGWQVYGPEMLAALQPLQHLPDDHRLRGATHLSLCDIPSMTDISAVAALSGLVSLNLRGATALTDAAPLVTLGALAQLDLGGCTAISPRPERRSMEDRGSVLHYQRKVARALEREPDRSPQRDAWLEIAREAGLLERPEADLQRQQSAPSVSAIRKLLCARSLDAARQGFALMQALDDPSVLSELMDGVTITQGGSVEISRAAARRAHLRRRDRRNWVALALLRGAGRLDRVTRVYLSSYGELTLPDLAPLAGLTQLRRLTIPRVTAEDLSPLATLTALYQLDLNRCQRLTDLSPLAGLDLHQLDLNYCASLQDLSGLEEMPHLHALNLRNCYGLPSDWRKNHTTRREIEALIRKVTR